MSPRRAPIDVVGPQSPAPSPITNPSTPPRPSPLPWHPPLLLPPDSIPSDPPRPHPHSPRCPLPTSTSAPHHPFGYRLYLRLYPDGDGDGRGTHLSLFMALAKGPYDDLLPWPFLHKVTFYLLDPWRRRPPLRETFAPDPHSTSFQQPRGQRNVASGSPLFAPHGQLQNYLKDNTLYVKAVLPFAGL
uniref:TRAF1-6 MATH domain-containing protein n=1 Tax=Chelydra serpentina TaxID=8475 RepID=A0A8C3SN82_CHESE